MNKDHLRIFLTIPLICMVWFYFGIITVIDIWNEWIDGIPLLIAPLIGYYLIKPILKYKITIVRKNEN